MSATLDSLDRPLRDLRISLTDRCNFRCGYCMPAATFGPRHVFLQPDTWLSFKDIVRVSRAFGELGVKNIRLTGGEPLLRAGIERLISALSALGFTLSLTTNGSRLEAKADALYAAGLRRLTVSLDAIDPTIFSRMNGVGFPLEKVLSGLAAAKAAGFAGMKINMVVQRSLNLGQVVPMAHHFRGTGLVLRFIEFMDVGSCNGWQASEVVRAEEIIDQIAASYPITALPRTPGETAQRWRYDDGAGEIGVIASVSAPFCNHCTRARVSADGQLFTCLFAGTGTDLRAPLAAGNAALRHVIECTWRARIDRYSMDRAHHARVPIRKVEMSYIGG